MIERILEQELTGKLFKGKIILLSGPSMSGKSTLVRKLLESTGKSYDIFDGRKKNFGRMSGESSEKEIMQMAEEHDLLCVDGAQQLPEIWNIAGRILEKFSNKQLIICRSSMFDQDGHPDQYLKGRKWTIPMFPVSWEEWENHIGRSKAERDLENRLIFGMYPEILKYPGKQVQTLDNLLHHYLLKDIFAYAGIRKPVLIERLLQLLSVKAGQEIIYGEIGEMLGVDHKTISSYIDMLEKAFIVFRLPSFSGAVPNEIKSSRKVYFLDNGIRNAVTGDFETFKKRKDKDILWENFLISERLKQLRYKKHAVMGGYWRTRQQQEVGYTEKRGSKVSGYTFRWDTDGRMRAPRTFEKAYASRVLFITPENFRDFVVV